MAVPLTQLVNRAVRTGPTAEVNLGCLKDLLHAIVRCLAAGQNGDVLSVAPSVPVTDSSDSSSAVTDGSTSADGQGEATGGRKEDEGDASGGRTLYALSESEVRAMEQKLSALEQRVNNLQSLEKIEEKAGEGGTPLSDQWNFTHLTQRQEGTEQGLTQVCSTVDQMAKELHNLRQSVNEIGEKIKALSETLSLMQGAESADASARSKLQEIEDALTTLKADLNEKYATCEELDDLVTWSALEDALKARIPTPPPQPPPQPVIPEPVTAKERVKSAKKNPSKEAIEALQKVGALTDKHDQLCDEVGGLENALSAKLDASALENMLPREALEALQARIKELENDMNKKVLEEVEGLRQSLKSIQDAAENAAAIDAEKLNAIFASHEANENLVADMASQLAQLRERLAELDRTLNAVQEATAKQPASPVPAIDPEVLEMLHNQLQAARVQTDELTGQMSHVVHDIDMNTGRLQNLYDQVVVLNEIKADREFVTLEVKEKADRDQLQEKASRAWVDSHLHRLGEEVTDAKQMVIGQEEKFHSRVHELSSEVETKLDRLELEPLKNYLEGKIQTAIPKVNVDDGKEPEERDAAGMRRALLRFRCISCDRPVYMRPEGPVPTLPGGQGMPPQRAIKAYTSYELEQIRQQQRLASGIPIDDDVITATSLRSCGGRYTTTSFLRKPSRHVPPILHPDFSPYTLRDINATKSEQEIVGQDGHVYRGRGGPKSDKLPNVHAAGGKVLPTVPHSRSRYARAPRTAPPQSASGDDQLKKPVSLDAALNVK